MFEIHIGRHRVRCQVIYKPIRHTYIRIKDQDLLQISTPRHTQIEAIRNLILKNEPKLTRMLESVQAKPIFAFESTWLWGHKYPIQLIGGKKARVAFKGDYLECAGTDKDLMLVALEEFYVREVITRATELMQSFQKEMASDIDISHVTLKSQRMKSRLGSCIPQKKIIKLNSILARLSPIYIRAILIHELVHLNVSNHQAAFYRLLLKYEPDYRRLRKELLKEMKMIEV